MKSSYCLEQFLFLSMSMAIPDQSDRARKASSSRNCRYALTRTLFLHIRNDMSYSKVALFPESANWKNPSQ